MIGLAYINFHTTNPFNLLCLSHISWKTYIADFYFIICLLYPQLSVKCNDAVSNVVMLVQLRCWTVLWFKSLQCLESNTLGKS